jgi:hypothetical protein
MKISDARHAHRLCVPVRSKLNPECAVANILAPGRRAVPPEGRGPHSTLASDCGGTPSFDGLRQRSHHLDARHHDGHRPSINAAKCPRVVNGSLTGSEHHRSRSEGTLRRHRSNHDASSPRRDRAPASSARPSPIPHRVRDRTTTPSSRRLREQIPKVWGYGSWRRQAAGSAPASGQRRGQRLRSPAH